MDTDPKINTIGSNRKGFAFVYFALTIAALMGFLALAIDLGHMYVVRGELQNAADASALAGAASLYKDPLNPTAATSLDFNRARNAATSFVSQNKSDGVSLANGTIATGCWNWTSKQMEACTKTPPVSPQFAAVAATVARSGGNNNGPVPTFFARVFGVDDTAVSSRTAVAMVSGPSKGGPLFPMALSSCMTDHYFSQNPMPSTPPTINITSVYAPVGSGCYTGQWTSFQLDTNNVPDIRDLIWQRIPSPLLQIDDNIWIQPGTKATIFQEVNTWLPAGGKDVLMAVVDTGDTSSGSIMTHSEMKIKGFATFHIDGAVATGNSKHVFGHFNAYYTTYPGTESGGPVYNSITNAQMVQ